jgi:hypothetical protein
MVVFRNERVYDKYAWLVPFVMGSFFIVSMAATIFSTAILTGAEIAVETFTGITFSKLAISSPSVANYVYYLLPMFAILSAGLVAFIMFLSATAYKKGERWAWYSMWITPVLFLLDFSKDYRVLRHVDFGSIVIIAILVIGLLLPLQKVLSHQTTC